MLVILARQAVKSMALGWVLRVMSLLIVPNPGWLADTALALFCASAWLLALAGALGWRRRREAARRELDQCGRIIAQGRAQGRSAHFHEASAGSWHGYLTGAGYQDRQVLGRHLIVVQEGDPCALCERMALLPDGDPAWCDDQDLADIGRGMDALASLGTRYESQRSALRDGLPGAGH